MRTFGSIKPKDYTIQTFYTSAPMSWELISSSFGIEVTSPTELNGAVTINRAANDVLDFYGNATPRVNYDGVYEYVQYSSIRHLFYDRGVFYSGSRLTTQSLAGIPNDSYVISVGQYFYGERVKPGSFELSLDAITAVVTDDTYGNLIVSQSGTGSYVGNIFYDYGIAVVTQNTASAVSTVGSNGIKIVNGTEIYVDYSSDVKITRHEINVKVEDKDYNLSLFNPSMRQIYTNTGSVGQSFVDMNIPQTASYAWTLYNLMHGGVIKPYITSVGLYNDRYELLAVAKFSTPIQRTFDMEQIFIVRFDADIDTATA